MNDLQIAASLRRFMLVNKRFYFSKPELEYVAKNILSKHKVPKTKLTASKLNKVLEEHGIKGCWQKHSKSERHHLWSRGHINPVTLELTCKI